MSILVHESAINPDKNIWVQTTFDANSIAGTGAGTTSPALNANQNTYLNTTGGQINNGAGKYVITGMFQWTTAASTATILRGYLFDATSDTTASTSITTAAAGSFSSSAVMTITTTGPIELSQYVNSTVAGPTCKAQWSVLFFPSNN
jgi:hypothetical protein